MRELKGSVVMPIVADEPIADGRLRRRGFERRMGVDHAAGSIEAGIRHAPLSRPTVVARDVFDQPINRVVGIAGLVDIAARAAEKMRLRLDQVELKGKTWGQAKRAAP